jgi:hypothetical protein
MLLKRIHVVPSLSFKCTPRVRAMAENDTSKEWASPTMARSRPQIYGLAQLAIN